MKPKAKTTPVVAEVTPVETKTTQVTEQQDPTMKAILARLEAQDKEIASLKEVKNRNLD